MVLFIYQIASLDVTELLVLFAVKQLVLSSESLLNLENAKLVSVKLVLNTNSVHVGWRESGRENSYFKLTK